jgi:hypothetical protein
MPWVLIGKDHELSGEDLLCGIAGESTKSSSDCGGLRGGVGGIDWQGLLRS